MIYWQRNVISYENDKNLKEEILNNRKSAKGLDNEMNGMLSSWSIPIILN